MGFASMRTGKPADHQRSLRDGVSKNLPIPVRLSGGQTLSRRPALVEMTAFAGYDFSIFTLRLKDEETLKTRVLNETRSSAYRDSAEAVRINQSLFNRSAYQNEIFIDLKDQPTEFVVEQILLNLN